VGLFQREDDEVGEHEVEKKIFWVGMDYSNGFQNGGAPARGGYAGGGGVRGTCYNCTVPSLALLLSMDRDANVV